MMAHTIEEIQNMLCMKKTDFFISYGLGEIGRAVVEEFIKVADVSSAISMQVQKEYRLRTKIYESFKELPGHNIFDKVLCIYQELPQSEREKFNQAASRCLTLCTPNGMVLFIGLKNKSQVVDFISSNNITKYWFIGESNGEFDFLIKKNVERKPDGKR